MIRVIEVLTDIATVCGSQEPFAWTEHAGKVFIAGLNYETNSTMLHIYDVEELRDWVQRALEYEQTYHETWDNCVFATQQRDSLP